MANAPNAHAPAFGNQLHAPARISMPWQLWVVTVLLAIEGLLGNFPPCFQNPAAAIWLAAKCLFITGFFLRWRPIYVIFLIEAALHAIVFAPSAPIVALINLVMLVLVVSTAKYFFRAR